MVDQGDYNADASTLVPGSLVAFRHFQLIDGRLKPMSWSYRRELTFYESLRDRYDPYEPGRLSLDTYKIEAPVYESDCTSGFAHEAPRPECKCGFYASYDPATDFYPGKRWGKGYAEAVAVPGEEGEGIVIVRAVVEVTGRTVMGRLGVRAQRMKIKALAVDWSKYTSPAEVRRAQSADFYYDDFYDTTLRPRLRSGPSDADRWADEEAEAKERADAQGRARYAAEMRYGCEFYRDTEAMHAAHPMADIEALGVDTSPPPSPGVMTVTVNGIDISTSVSRVSINTPRQNGRSQYAVYARQLADSVQGFQVQAVVWDEAITHATEELTAFEKALKAKQNRPAPPGTGIDRRKRKL